MAKLRVIQWATGNVGLKSLAGIIGHPRMELVGVHVHSADKVGRDAGELCGLPPVGVAATDDKAALIALKADCILYMPFETDMDEVAAILAAGTNIVTTKGDFQNPATMDPADRAKIEAACAAGGSSVHCTGSSPGFATDALPILLATMQRRLDCLTVDEYADSSSRNSPAIIFDAMQLGRPPSPETSARMADYMWHSRRRSFHLLADAFGLPLDEVVTEGEEGLALRRTEIAAGVVEAGTVGGRRITITGMRGGRPLLRFRANWYVTPEMDVDWGELMHSGWRVRVDGDTPLDVTIRFPVSLEEYPVMSPGLTAHPAVNAVEATCAGRPGILTSVDLGVVVPVFGAG